MSSTAPLRRRVAIAAIVLTVAFGAVLRLRPWGEFTMRAIDDVGQSLAAGLGAGGCFWRMRSSTRRWRLSWMLIGAALACWAAGELVWSYYELMTQRETPFPSIADLGYLLFPALALPGLMLRPSSFLGGTARVRLILDGVMVAGSLFTVSWATSLGQVYRSGAQDNFAFAVGLAYPASDVVMLTVAVLVLAHALRRTGLPLLVLGLAAMAVADSGFAYLTATGSYHTGAIVDVAWFAAFLLIGVSAVMTDPHDEVQHAPLEAPVFLALPYVVVLVGGAAQVVMIVRNRETALTLFVEVIAVGAILIRQFLTVIDNRRLALDVMSQQAELRFRAFHDALTGLANRALFYDRVAHALELHTRDQRPVSVMFCDLDDFKSINDSLGHGAGDALLTAVAERLARATRAGDTVARIGGDEFAILVEDDVDVQVLADRLLDTLAEPLELGERVVTIRASIGTATVLPGDEAMTSEDLLKRADLAMYAAKRAGKGTAMRFSKRLHAPSPDDLDQRLVLADDIRSGAIRTAFQPIVSIDGQPFAFEALSRWSYRGVEVPPVQFIPMAESAGLLDELDLLTIRNALAHAAAAPQSSRLLVSVNMGLTHLRRSDTPTRLLALLAESGIPSERLIVELPESQALTDPAILGFIERMRELGLPIALDDFGIGYSNMARLGRLRPDYVKLDRSLIEPLGESAAEARLVAGIIDLAHDLGAVVIGEGVETERQLDILRELNCDAVQGYLIGRPVVPDAQPAEAREADVREADARTADAREPAVA